MKRCLFNASISSLLLTSALSVSAQQEGEEDDLYLLYGDDEMISIATGFSQPISKAPSTASVITAEDIKAMGATTLDEVMERVPGVHVSPSKQNALNNFVFRGIKTSFTSQVLVMLNGHRISSDLYSSTMVDGSVFSIENISRIEVIRGPGSAVYGADAFSGVINIITKTAKELDGQNFGVRAGSFNYTDVWGQYGGEINDDWDIALSFEYAKKDSDKSQIVTSDLQSILDLPPASGGFGTSASLAPSYLDSRYEATTYNIHINNTNWKIGLDGSVQRDNGVKAGIGQALDHDGHYDTDQHLFTLEYGNKEWLDDWEFLSKLSYQTAELQSQLNIFPSGTVLFIGDDGNAFSTPSNVACPVLPVVGQQCIVQFPDGFIGNPGRVSTTSQLDFTFLFNGMDDHVWRFNVGGSNHELEANSTQNFGPDIINGTQPVVDGTLTDVTGLPDTIYVSDEDRTIAYISIQDVWDFAADWSLTAGVRYDDYSDFGNTTNPRAALVWNAKENMIVKLLYGSAFRAPSFSELYTKNNPVGVGTSTLNAEKIDTLELAVSYEPISNLSTGINIYIYETENMIDFIDDGSGTNTNRAVNDKDLKGEGFELEMNWLINDQWQVIGNYANQSTENKATNTQEGFIPKQQLYVDVRFNFLSNWLLSTQANWVADRVRDQGDPRDNISDYTLVDMSLRYKSSKDNWEVASSISNLFDEDAFEPSDGKIPDDYPLNERSINIEFRYHIN